MEKIHLVIIDPQNDFCDSKGSLFVPGAEADMTRLAGMIKRVATKLSDIHVTLDSHHAFDVAHPLFWKDSSGKAPNPFTLITYDDVKSGKWAPRLPFLYQHALDYTKALEANNRYVLCVWPPHCLIGSWGTQVVQPLYTELCAWETAKVDMVNYVTKGSNYKTEHYSAIKAEVPDPQDPSTRLNTSLIQSLEKADRIVFAGEAGSHCLKFTMIDIVEALGGDSYLPKITLLTDATSPVGSFESQMNDFISDYTKKGMQVATTTSFLA